MTWWWYLWWTWYPAALILQPGSSGSGIFAVLAIRCWTSLHVNAGLGKEAQKRISSNTSSLSSVLYCKWNHGGSSSTLNDTLKRNPQREEHRLWSGLLQKEAGGLWAHFSRAELTVFMQRFTDKPLQWDADLHLKAVDWLEQVHKSTSLSQAFMFYKCQLKLCVQQRQCETLTKDRRGKCRKKGSF